MPASGDFPVSPKIPPPFSIRRIRNRGDIPAIESRAASDSTRERVSGHSLSRSRAPRVRGQFAISFDLYDDILGVADYRMHARCNTDRNDGLSGSIYALPISNRPVARHVNDSTIQESISHGRQKTDSGRAARRRARRDRAGRKRG
ncbi:hypothetical protein [Burkholderia territorii]|uniref:hypothetical protein n=1 Tax=Burkholderia territorii TaxID=1503055 RepID=UPI0012DA072B|nr:hypothetical protein [Burkholderia territorii]